MTRKVNLLLSTRKGAFVFESDSGRGNCNWSLRGPSLEHSLRSRRCPMVRFPCLQKCGGHTWNEPTSGPVFPEDAGRKLESIWNVVPGRDSEPEVVYAGVQPAALFKSLDNGDTCKSIQHLKIIRRDRWETGAGGLCLHTIILNP